MTIKNLDKNKIIEFYKHGNSGIQIAKKFNCSTEPIYRTLKEYNIIRKPIGLSLGHEKCCLNCNKNFLQKPNEYYRNFLKRKFCSARCSAYYNMIKNGNPMLGKHHSEETKLKIRNFHLGSKHNSCSEERKQKISNKAKERWQTQEFKDKMQPILNKVHKSEERNNKISLKNKGKIVNLNTRIKQSSVRRGISVDKWDKFISREPYDQKWDNRFKNEIRNRDNQVCMNCGIHREKLKTALNIHHINYNKELSIPQNCISLCKKCHMLTNYRREFWTPFFQSMLSERYGYKYSEDGKVILNIEVKNV